MTFLLNGDTITQNGIDTDLSGLATINSVNVIIHRDHKDYFIDGLKLNIMGTLSLDPELETLHFGETCPWPNMENNGQLNIGTEVIVNDDKIYSQGTVAIFSRQASVGWNSSNISFHQKSGILNLNGGEFIFSAPIFLRAGEINCKNINFISRNAKQGYAEIITGAVKLENINCYRNGFKLTVPPLLFNNNTIINSKSIGVFVLFETYVLENYDYVGKSSIYLFKQNALNRKITAKNAAKGTACEVTTYANSVGIVKEAYCAFTKDIKYSVQNINGQAINNVNIFTNDIDHGKRAIVAGTDFTENKSYSQTTDNNGIASFTDILLGVKYTLSGSSQQIKDYRGINNDNSDIFRFYLSSYNYLPQKIDIDLKGKNIKNMQAILVLDQNVSQIDKTIVENYQIIDNLDQLYDAIKAFIIKDPLILKDTKIFTMTNLSTIDISPYSLVFTKNSPQAINISGNIITVKTNKIVSGSKFKQLKTSGTITFANDTEITINYTDDTNNSSIYFNNIDNWSVYKTNLERSNEQNPITTGQYGFRYKFISPRVYYFKLLKNGDYINKDIAINKIGYLTIDLSNLTILNKLLTTTEENNILLLQQYRKLV